MRQRTIRTTRFVISPRCGSHSGLKLADRLVNHLLDASLGLPGAAETDQRQCQAQQSQYLYPAHGNLIGLTGRFFRATVRPGVNCRDRSGLVQNDTVLSEPRLATAEPLA